MSQVDTVDRILHAATVLFAERGFAETSLRTITGMADVNLAAVNYHFGSKKELIQAVFSRFLVPFCRELDKSMDELEKNLAAEPSPKVKDLLEMLFANVMKATDEIHEEPQRFMRLIGLAYTQSQDHLRHYLVRNHGESYHRFATLLQSLAPGLTPVEFYWRLYFTLGASIFTLSSYDSIRAILNVDFNEDTPLPDTIDMMTSSLSNIFNVAEEPV